LIDTLLAGGAGPLSFQDEVAMAVDTAHQLRVVVQPKARTRNAEIARVVHRRLGRGWRVRRLTHGRPLVLLTGRSTHLVGTSEHARESHEAALALRRSTMFSRAEADVTVPVDVGPEVTDPSGPFSDDCAQNPPPLSWVRDLLRWSEAMAEMPAAASGGAGIRIGHPDSGYTLHPKLGAARLDLTTDRDVIDSDDDALDDLIPNPNWPLPNPGHGTSTASVIVGQGSGSDPVLGLAPRAKLVPIRATESVVQLFDSDVAKAVGHARQVGCHIVSMSLGGKGFFGLKGELQRAVDAGMIVMAAAGNYVRVVTAPASYDNCLAVAATGPGDSLWADSSRGPAIDVSMPGSCVYNAAYADRNPIVRTGHGTSFAVAHLAAAAAFWLAHHGRDSLIQRYGATRIQTSFLAVLRWPGVCLVPAGWDRDYGLGRVDLLALLQAPLPAPGDLEHAGAFGTHDDDAVGRIAAMIGEDRERIRIRLAELLKVSTPSELDRTIAEHEGELVYLVLADRAFADRVRREDAAAAFPLTIKTAGGDR